MPPFCLSIALMTLFFLIRPAFLLDAVKPNEARGKREGPSAGRYTPESRVHGHLSLHFIQSVNPSIGHGHPNYFLKRLSSCCFFPQNVPRFRLRICPAKKAKPVLSSRVCPRQAHLSLSHRRKPCLSFCPQGFEHVVSACLTTKLRSTHTMTYSPALEV
jgi:hypothetical protein